MKTEILDLSNCPIHLSKATMPLVKLTSNRLVFNHKVAAYFKLTDLSKIKFMFTSIEGGGIELYFFFTSSSDGFPVKKASSKPLSEEFSVGGTLLCEKIYGNLGLDSGDNYKMNVSLTATEEDGVKYYAIIHKSAIATRRPSNRPRK